MSILQEVQRLASVGELEMIGGRAVQRPMFVRPDIFAFMIGPHWATKELQDLGGKLRNELERFVEGRLVSFSLEPYKKPKQTYMAAIAPTADNVFSIRVRDPDPGLRVFGHFAAPDWFVALNFAFRDDLPRWRDDWEEPEGDAPTTWRNERERCKAIWRQLFPTYNPHAGATHNDYITGNIIPFPDP